MERILDDDRNYVHKYICTTNLETSPTAKNNNLYIYKYREPSDFFVLLIEGCYIVEASSEKVEFLTKQFDYFGVDALIGKNHLKIKLYNYFL